MLLILALLPVLAFASSNIAEEEGVLVLTEKNFDEAIAQHKNLLVEFCKFGISLAPGFPVALSEA